MPHGSVLKLAKLEPNAVVQSTLEAYAIGPRRLRSWQSELGPDSLIEDVAAFAWWCALRATLMRKLKARRESASASWKI